MANQRLSRKILNICIVCIIIIAIIFIAMMLILNYDVKGETNMPFQISKIYIVSTVDGQDVESDEYKWNINVNQNNDIYLYVEKNKEYSKQETISSIKLDNFNIKQKPTIGELQIYKPTVSDTSIFQNIDENIAKEIVFKGTKSSDTRNLEISNQGGPVAFRCANNNIGIFSSNDDEKIDFYQLLKKLNISEENLTCVVSFNMTLTLDSGKSFKAENIELKIPNSNIVEEGRIGIEYTDLQNIIFKRIEN